MHVSDCFSYYVCTIAAFSMFVQVRVSNELKQEEALLLNRPTQTVLYGTECY